MERCQSFDIFVADDNAPASGGTALQCLETLFCNGRLGIVEAQRLYNNSNCHDTVHGIIGLPGKGSCPAN
jgi:hypothetical protein